MNNEKETMYIIQQESHNVGGSISLIHHQMAEIITRRKGGQRQQSQRVM